MARLLKIVRISTLPRLQPSLSPSALRRLQPYRHLSLAFIVDTLALERSLEEQGLPSKQAEAITTAIAQILNVSKESFVSKKEMDKVRSLEQRGLLSKQADATTSGMAQILNASKESFVSKQEMEKEHHLTMLRSDMNIMKTELKSEIETVTAGSRAQMEAATAGSRAQLEAATAGSIGSS